MRQNAGANNQRASIGATPSCDTKNNFLHTLIIGDFGFFDIAYFIIKGAIRVGYERTRNSTKTTWKRRECDQRSGAHFRVTVSWYSIVWRYIPLVMDLISKTQMHTDYILPLQKGGNESITSLWWLAKLRDRSSKNWQTIRWFWWKMWFFPNFTIWLQCLYAPLRPAAWNSLRRY